MRETRGTRLIHLVGILAVALTIAGCQREGAAEIEPYTAPGLRSADGSVAASELYARECAWCHGGRGEGTERAPNLNGELDGAAYTHFMLDSGRMPIADPEAAVRRSTPVFSDQQIQALADYVAGFENLAWDME